jgi:3-carboxy-cis,cis-muconate cycloisomerase
VRSLESIQVKDLTKLDPMRRVWSDENRTQKYLDIEAALARVQARLGIIPQEAADEINRHCRVEQIDLTKLKRDTERIGYPVLGVVATAERALPRSPRRVLPLGHDDAGHH